MRLFSAQSICTLSALTQSSPAFVEETPIQCTLALQNSRGLVLAIAHHDPDDWERVKP